MEGVQRWTNYRGEIKLKSEGARNLGASVYRFERALDRVDGDGSRDVKVAVAKFKGDDAYEPRFRFDKFEVEALLGCGGFGKVWKATLKSSGEGVGLKQYSTAEVPHQDVWKERDLLVTLKHPRICKILGAFHDRDVFMVLQLCYGSLAGVINRLTERNKLRFAIQLAQGLEWIHSQNVIHADLNPDNCLVTTSNNLVISDFGTALILKPGFRSVKSLRSLGSGGYQDYEVNKHLHYSKESDMFSFACVLFEIETGAYLLHYGEREVSNREYARAFKDGRIRHLRDAEITDDMQRQALVERVQKAERFTDLLKSLIQDRPTRMTAAKFLASDNLGVLMSDEGLSMDEIDNDLDWVTTEFNINRNKKFFFHQQHPSWREAVMYDGIYYDEKDKDNSFGGIESRTIGGYTDAQIVEAVQELNLIPKLVGALAGLNPQNRTEVLNSIEACLAEKHGPGTDQRDSPAPNDSNGMTSDAEIIFVGSFEKPLSSKTAPSPSPSFKVEDSMVTSTPPKTGSAQEGIIASSTAMESSTVLRSYAKSSTDAVVPLTTAPGVLGSDQRNAVSSSSSENVTAGSTPPMITHVTPLSSEISSSRQGKNVLKRKTTNSSQIGGTENNTKVMKPLTCTDHHLSIPVVTPAFTKSNETCHSNSQPAAKPNAGSSSSNFNDITPAVDSTPLSKSPDHLLITQVRSLSSEDLAQDGIINSKAASSVTPTSCGKEKIKSVSLVASPKNGNTQESDAASKSLTSCSSAVTPASMETIPNTGRQPPNIMASSSSPSVPAASTAVSSGYEPILPLNPFKKNPPPTSCSSSPQSNPQNGKDTSPSRIDGPAKNSASSEANLSASATTPSPPNNGASQVTPVVSKSYAKVAAVRSDSPSSMSTPTSAVTQAKKTGEAGSPVDAVLLKHELDDFPTLSPNSKDTPGVTPNRCRKMARRSLRLKQGTSTEVPSTSTPSGAADKNTTDDRNLTGILKPIRERKSSKDEAKRKVTFDSSWEEITPNSKQIPQVKRGRGRPPKTMRQDQSLPQDSSDDNQETVFQCPKCENFEDEDYDVVIEHKLNCTPETDDSDEEEETIYVVYSCKHCLKFESEDRDATKGHMKICQNNPKNI